MGGDFVRLIHAEPNASLTKFFGTHALEIGAWQLVAQIKKLTEP
jgi:hypothetical protein